MRGQRRADAAHHHWSDPIAGLREMRRVARKVIVFQWDNAWLLRYWLVRDYIPEFGVAAGGRPSLQDRADPIDASVEPVATPWDCVDGFFHCYWRRPEAYLDPAVRRNTSVWGPPRAHDRTPRRRRASRRSRDGALARTQRGPREPGRDGPRRPTPHRLPVGTPITVTQADPRLRDRLGRPASGRASVRTLTDPRRGRPEPAGLRTRRALPPPHRPWRSRGERTPRPLF